MSGGDGPGTDAGPESNVAGDPTADGDPDDDEASVGAVLFTYLAPFLGVLLVAVGIAAAVPGGYALVQEDIATCGSPTISVTPVADDGGPTPSLPTFAYEELSPAERAAVDEALADPRGEAHVRGAVPHGEAFREKAVVVRDGRRYAVTVVSENPCFDAAPLQFPLGVFAIGFGVVAILTPPLYRRLVALEERVR